MCESRAEAMQEIYYILNSLAALIHNVTSKRDGAGNR